MSFLAKICIWCIAMFSQPVFGDSCSGGTSSAFKLGKCQGSTQAFVNLCDQAASTLKSGNYALGNRYVNIVFENINSYEGCPSWSSGDLGEYVDSGPGAPRVILSEKFTDSNAMAAVMLHEIMHGMGLGHEVGIEQAEGDFEARHPSYEARLNRECTSVLGGRDSCACVEIRCNESGKNPKNVDCERLSKKDCYRIK